MLPMMLRRSTSSSAFMVEALGLLTGIPAHDFSMMRVDILFFCLHMRPLTMFSVSPHVYYPFILLNVWWEKLSEKNLPLLASKPGLNQI